MTLFVLESGLSKASEVTKKFFKKSKLFFVRKNNNGTISFISAMFPDDVLTTSSIKSLSQEQNGYMQIITQNSVINITPFVVGCFKLYPYLIEEMIADCSFIKTEPMPYKSVWDRDNGIYVDKAKEKLTLISELNISQPSYYDNQWIDGVDRLFKDTEGYLYLEQNYVISKGLSKITEHNSFIKTNIKIG